MNALQELSRHIDSIKCANIVFSPYYQEDETGPEGKSINLKVGYSSEEFEEFKKALNFSYDAGYGTQELYGRIWLNDGTWLDRGEYDGSEWWAHSCVPEIPEELKGD